MNGMLRAIARWPDPMAQFGHDWVLDTGARQFRAPRCESAFPGHAGRCGRSSAGAPSLAVVRRVHALLKTAVRAAVDPDRSAGQELRVLGADERHDRPEVVGIGRRSRPGSLRAADEVSPP